MRTVCSRGHRGGRRLAGRAETSDPRCQPGGTRPTPVTNSGRWANIRSWYLTVVRTTATYHDLSHHHRSESRASRSRQL